MTIFLRLVLAAAVLGAAAGLVLGAVPSLHPAADSFAHFRVHFAAILGFAAVLLALFARGTARFLLLGSSAAMAMGIAWAWLDAPPSETAQDGLTVLQFNMLYRNAAIADVIARLREHEAEIVTLQEVTSSSLTRLEALVDLYPHRRHCRFGRVGGVAILSQHPFRGEATCLDGRGLVVQTIDAPSGPLTVASLHTHWPWPMGQHGQIDGWIETLRKIEGTAIVAGDFNAAPWSHAVGRIEAASDTAAISGLRRTIVVTLRRLGLTVGVPIPIDHILVTDDLCPLAIRTLDQTGSDHFPVIATLRRGGCEG